MKLVNYILLAIVGMLLFVALMVVLAGSTGMDMGNMSDIVSAGCNVAMAGAAVSGAITANNWFKRKTAENTYSLAVQLKTNLEELTKNVARDYWTIASRIDDYHSCTPGYSECHDANSYRYEYLAMFSKIKEYRDEIVRIENNGIKVSNKEFLLESIQACEDFYTCACAIFKHQYSLINPDDDIGDEHYDEALKFLKPQSKKIKTITEELMNTPFSEIFSS